LDKEAAFIDDLQVLLRQFRLGAEPYGFVRARELLDGLINRTYAVETERADGPRRYIVQKINTYVFRRPAELMENIVAVTAYLRERIAAGEAPGQTTLSIVPAQDGRPYHVDAQGGFWRCYEFVENTYSLQAGDEDASYRAGKIFGTFLRLLDGFPLAGLHETIPGFHDTPKRYQALEAAVAENAAGRRDEVVAEIAFARARKNDCEILLNLCGAGKIPLRVTHNDTKLNNVLFDCDTREAVCVVDFDTIMPGLSLYDFGDALRFLGNAAAEDERDLSKVTFRMPLFRAYARGYLEAAAGALNETERRMLPFSIKLMTFECGIRYLADYLNGDVYFRTRRPDDNLARCRTQFKLVEEIEGYMAEMEDFIKSL